MRKYIYCESLTRRPNEHHIAQNILFIWENAPYYIIGEIILDLLNKIYTFYCAICLVGDESVHIKLGIRIQRSREGYFGVYFPSCEAMREINTKITLEWAQKQFVTRVHTSFYFLRARHDESTNDDKNDDLYTSSPCLTRSVIVLVMTS